MNPDLLAKWDATMKRIDSMFPKSKHALESLHRIENYREHLHKREGQCGSFQQYQKRNEWYHVDRYLKSIQLDIPTFDGRLNYSRSSPQNFLDLLQSMDMYFTRYLLSEAEKVSFAAMKLTGQASHIGLLLRLFMS